MADAYQHFVMDVAEVRKFYSQILDIRELSSKLAASTRDPAWIKVGVEADAIRARLNARLDSIARLIAAMSEVEITKVLKSEQVRPPTGNRPGLEGSIKSDAPPFGNFSFGVVEVALISELDAALGLGGEPYWRTQEFGYRGNIGRKLFGAFHGGGVAASAPDPAQFRVHPLFTQGAPGGGKATITRPIQAKKFLQRGTAVARDEWKKLVATAVRTAAAELNALTASLP